MTNDPTVRSAHPALCQFCPMLLGEASGLWGPWGTRVPWRLRSWGMQPSLSAPVGPHSCYPGLHAEGVLGPRDSINGSVPGPRCGGPQTEHWALVTLVPGRGHLSRYASECQMLGFRCDPVRLLGGSLASGYGPVKEEVAWSWHPCNWADGPVLSPGRLSTGCPPLCQLRPEAPAPPFVSCVVLVNLCISLSSSFLLCKEGGVAPASTRSLCRLQPR